MSKFKAFRISNNNGKISGAIVDTTVDELTPGDVVIKAEYSSVNYKDALAATGTGKILTRFPLIGGIDVAGKVTSSTDRRFREGGGRGAGGREDAVAGGPRPGADVGPAAPGQGERRPLHVEPLRGDRRESRVEAAVRLVQPARMGGGEGRAKNACGLVVGPHGVTPIRRAHGRDIAALR